MTADLSAQLQGWGTVVAVAVALALAVLERRHESKRLARDAQEAHRRDLDETRRVLYIAVVRTSPEVSGEARATIVNALAHHSGLLSAGEAVELVGGRAESHRAADAARTIGRICQELGEPIPQWGRQVPIGWIEEGSHDVYGAEARPVFEAELAYPDAFYAGKGPVTDYM